MVRYEQVRDGSFKLNDDQQGHAAELLGVLYMAVCVHERPVPKWTEELAEEARDFLVEIGMLKVVKEEK